MAEPTIEDYFHEDRSFPPPASFVAEALVTDRSLYDEAAADCLAQRRLPSQLSTVPSRGCDKMGARTEHFWRRATKRFRTA